MKKLITACTLGSLVMASCATVFTSKEQDMSFDSNEKNVEIYINGEKKCTTPCITKVRRSRDTLLIVARKDGFDDQTRTVSTGINVVTLVNITSTTGFLTDLSTSYMWEYQPNAYYINMESVAATPQEKAQREKENEIRRFILSNYSDLKADSFSAGEKEYLKALSKLTGISLNKLGSMVSSTYEAVEFSDSVIKEFRK
ncbi:MAG: hypothetical protein LBL47_01550 [Lactobacillus sp.]|nr:hypothetical protein [Lactobacillus sp.]